MAGTAASRPAAGVAGAAEGAAGVTTGAACREDWMGAGAGLAGCLVGLKGAWICSAA